MDYQVVTDADKSPLSSKGGGSVEERLLVLLSFSFHSGAEEEMIRELVRAGPDWGRFERLAAENETIPLVHRNLARLGVLGTLPTDIRERLDAVTATVVQQAERRAAWAVPLFERLSEGGVPVCLLKGSSLAVTVYGDPAYKRMNDVDILVRKADLDAIFLAYEVAGLEPRAELIGGDPRAQESFSHHWPPFVNPDESFAVGTHWGLVSPRMGYRLDHDGMWHRAYRAEYYGMPLYTLAPEDTLHHLAIHLMAHYYRTGVRELADLYNLIRVHAATFNWARLEREVRHAGTHDAMYHALSLCNRLAPQASVQHLLDRLRGDVPSVVRWDSGRKSRSIPVVLHSRSDAIDVVEKGYADFLLASDAASRRRAYRQAVGGILFPRRDDALRMSTVTRITPARALVARAVASLRISRVIVRDLGLKMYCGALAGATVKVAVDALCSLRRRVGEP